MKLNKHKNIYHIEYNLDDKWIRLITFSDKKLLKLARLLSNKFRIKKTT